MQEVLIQTTNSNMKEVAKEHMHNRSLLYDKDNEVLYIKYNDELRPITAKVDDDNIVLNENNEISLNDDIHCKTLTVMPDESGVVYKDNVLFAETSNEKRIILLFKIDSNLTVGTLAGKFYEKSNIVTSSVAFSASVSGSRFIEGSSTADEVKYLKCKLGEVEYLGIKFNPNTKVYFSGYEYLLDESKIDFEYSDSDFESIVEITNNANQNTSTETYENPNRIDWDFKEYIDDLDEEHATTSGNEYDLTEGLVVNKNFEGKVYFHPNESLNGNVGFITLSGQGMALKLYISQPAPVSLKIEFACNTVGEARTLGVFDSSGTLITSTQSNSTNVLSTLKTENITTKGTYYIGSLGSRIRIYRVSLVYKKKTIIQEGWDAYNYTWDFTSLPNGWVQGKSTDLENGLTFIRHDGYDATLNRTNVFNNNNTYDTGYIVFGVPAGGANMLSVEVPHNGARLEVWTTTDRDGGNRTCAIYDKNGNLVNSIDNRYSNYQWSYPNQSGMGKMVSTNVLAGTYYIWMSAPMRIYKIIVSGAAQQEILQEEADNNIDTVVDVIENVEETGENGDSHYLTFRDMSLSMDDLERIASQLRNSDKPVHLDLSSCTVKEDATEWAGLFNKCTSLTYLAMPQGVKTIKGNTFVGCIFLEKIVFSDSLETFSSSSSEYIFAGNRVRTFVLPYNCKKISWNTFANSGARNIIVPPDCLNTFYSMLEYGSFYDTLDYIRVFMTQEQYNTHDWTITWEHSNFFGDTVDDTIAAHIIIYNDLDELLESLDYGDK